METQIQEETRPMRQDLPQNQQDKQLKQDWRGVKCRLVDDWLWIENEWEKYGPKLRPDKTVFKDPFNNTLDEMRNEERVEVAKRIYRLAEALREHLDGRT